MPASDNELTQAVREGLEKVCEEFTARMLQFGFQRTKKMFWTRRHPLTIDFIHFHRNGSTYGAPMDSSVDIRVHFGIRVLNSSFEAVALNGPYSDPTRLRSGSYHLRFNAKTGSTFERCVEDLVRFVVEQGEPWFQRFKTVDDLLEHEESPLHATEKELLRAARRDASTTENESVSLKVLGIKPGPQRRAPNKGRERS